MYCSACGVSIVQGLSYCKNCGARVDRGAHKSSELRAESLLATISAVFILGLVAITMLMGVMKVILRLDGTQVLGISLLPFLLLLIIEGVFIRLLLRRTKEPKESALAKQQVTNELDMQPPRALPESLPSITEHTTRAFDPIINEHKNHKTHA